MHFSPVPASAAVLAALFRPAASALNPQCHPGGNLDLSRWTLQLPVGSAGSPQTVPGGRLQGCAGYSDAAWFHTAADDGAVVMAVPGSPATSQCVTTANSKHCRTELREARPPSWDPRAAANRLFADVAVTRAAGDVCVGQIHIDDAVSHKPVAELYYGADGALAMGVQRCRTCDQKRFDIDRVAPGQRFTYEMRYEGGRLSVSINGKAFRELPTFDLGAPRSYFKAGNYNQGDGPSEVRFYGLGVTHS